MRGLMAGTNIDLYIQKCNKLTNNQYIMAEVKDGRYLIAKDIPLDPKGETVIKKGREIYLTNGVFYLDSVLLGPDYQYDFRELFKNEVKNGWNYVVPANPKMGESIVK